MIWKKRCRRVDLNALQHAIYLIQLPGNMLSSSLLARQHANEKKRPRKQRYGAIKQKILQIILVFLGKSTRGGTFATWIACKEGTSKASCTFIFATSVNVIC